MSLSSLPITSFSPGKIIVSGEHSVVYGHPALVMPTITGTSITIGKKNIDQTHPARPHLTHIQKVFADFFNDEKVTGKITQLPLDFKTALPIGSGLGSSAALAHATLKAYADFFQKKISTEEMIQLVQQSEVFAHQTPSGVDATAIVYQKPLVFQRNQDQLHFKFLKDNFLETLPFTLIYSGKPVETTKEMVSLVRLKSAEQKTQQILDRIGQLTKELTLDIQNQQFNPTLIQENERLLEELGVVSESAKALIKKIEAVGGMAKITGAGGIKKGAGMILAYHPEPEKLKAFL